MSWHLEINNISSNILIHISQLHYKSRSYVALSVSETINGNLFPVQRSLTIGWCHYINPCHLITVSNTVFSCRTIINIILFKIILCSLTGSFGLFGKVSHQRFLICSLATLLCDSFYERFIQRVKHRRSAKVNMLRLYHVVLKIPTCDLSAHIASASVGDKFPPLYPDSINVISKVSLDGLCSRNVRFSPDVANK